jgi:hypothetical protein
VTLSPVTASYVAACILAAVYIASVASDYARRIARRR